jgi:hypothetical protein
LRVNKQNLQVAKRLPRDDKGLDAMSTKRKFQAIGWAALAPLALLFAIFLVYAALMAEETRQEKLSVLNQGERTSGTIISQEVFSYSEGDSFLVKYTFTLSSGQEPFYGTYTFHDSMPSGWNVGDRILIAYDLQNPTINLPVNAGYEHQSNVIIWFGIVVVSLALGGLTFFLGYQVRKTWITPATR